MQTQNINKFEIMLNFFLYISGRGIEITSEIKTKNMSFQRW